MNDDYKPLCPICENANPRLHIEIEKIEGISRIECCVCDTIYFERPPEKLPVYNSEYNLHFFRPGDIRKAGIMAEKIANYANANFTLPTILEAGTGNGLTIWLLRQMGFDAFGLDLELEWVEYLVERFNIPMFTGKFEEFKYDIKFDMIYSSHVIEHVQDPRTFFKKAHEYLKDNGLFFIDTPDVQYWELAAKRWHHFETRTPFEHMCLLGIKGVRLLAEQYGFYFGGFKSLQEYGSMQILLRKGRL